MATPNTSPNPPRTPNTKKQTPTCPLTSKKCGGCPLLRTPYAKQLADKQAMAERLLGGYTTPRTILGMAEPWHYRNKAVATFAMRQGKLICGTYAVGTHKVLPATDCLLQRDILNKTIAAACTAAARCKWEAYDEDKKTGNIRHLLVRDGRVSGQVMVVLVTAEIKLPGSRNFVAELRRLAPWVTTVVQNYNPRQTSAVLGQDAKVLYGPGFITDTLCGVKFAISPRSFYQVNPVQTELLYQTALELAGLDGRQRVLDAYCGIGTIALCAAKKAAGVVGVERNPAAVKDANGNARHNKIANARFFCADATEWMRQAAAAANRGEADQFDVAFLDPPREGSTPECIAALCKMAPERIVYISCNPETLARDLALFTPAGYKVQTIQPVDMFPHTEHVETVVLMSKVR